MSNLIKVLMLSNSYIWGEKISVVEVKENKNFYTHQGFRYTKETSEKEPELLARRYGDTGSTYLYNLDTDYARKLIKKDREEKRLQKILEAINARIQKGLTVEQINLVSKVLDIEI